MMSGNVSRVLIYGAFLSFVLAVSLNAYLNIPGISPFNETIGDLSHKYQTGITPAGPTFSIWSLIYIWQAALLVYCVTLTCRKAYGSYVYQDPGFIPAIFFVSYIINMLGNPGWIVVFLMEMNVAGFFMLLLGVVTLVICLVTSCSKLVSCEDEMKKKGLSGDIWATRILVHNGLALYLAWVSLATSINAVIVLHYVLGVDMDACCWALLAVLNAVILVWFILETFVYDRYLRYVFTHYLTYICAFVGIYAAQYDPEVKYTIYELALLILVAVLAVAKLIIIIVRSIKDPQQTVKDSLDDKPLDKQLLL